MAATLFRRALMCKPTHFTVTYKINPWMSDTPVDSALALKQWQHLKATLEGAGVKVDVLDQVKGLPDMVFCCNAGIAVGNKFYLGHFRHPERQGERQHYEAWLKSNGFQVFGDTSIYFEGGGDACFNNAKQLLGGYGFRSQGDVYNKIEALGNFSVLRCKLVDNRFYHLDTCYCPLDDKSALWFPPAFDEESKERLRTSGLELIEVCEADALKFVCNSIAAGRTVAMPTGCEQTKALLEARGFTVVECDMSEFLKAGGACQCLVLKL